MRFGDEGRWMEDGWRCNWGGWLGERTSGRI
jgi:hypothetical protein